MKLGGTLLVAIGCVWTILSGRVLSETLKSFTIADEIGIANFDHWGTPREPIVVSPDGRFVAIRAERGMADKDRVEDEMRVYSMDALRKFVRDSALAEPPAPILDFREATYKWGPVISHIRWLPNSSGIAFLLTLSGGEHQLMLITLKHTQPRPLSLPGQEVTGWFDVRDATHYVYTVIRWGRELRPLWQNGQIAEDVTGWPLSAILLPQEIRERWIRDVSGGLGGVRSALWAADGRRPYTVLNAAHQPILIYSSISLSPDGRTLATALPVPNVPKSWLREFPPQSLTAVYRLRAGMQNLDVTAGYLLTKEYVLIDVGTGAVTPLNGAPTGESNGWWQTPVLAWSANGKAVLFSNAYLRPTHYARSVKRPCVGAFYPATESIKCLEPLKSMAEQDFFLIDSLRFEGPGSNRVLMQYHQYAYRDRSEIATKGEKTFERSPSGMWQVSERSDMPQTHGTLLDVFIKQSLNQPPVVAAEDPGTRHFRVIWDPNPQLKGIALGKASVYRWTDATGRKWAGGLYEAADYVAGHRYPLVIQTHGFAPNLFRASGIFPTAFAARALAASGMFVLQVPLCLQMFTPKEGPCEAASYNAAARKLVSQGLVDPNRIGIIGFSSTVYSVLEALTTYPLRFATASITDGWNWGYWDYIALVDSEENEYAHEANALVGATPFGSGLRLWLNRAPDFNLEKVRTPLLITSAGRLDLLGDMWEPYAVLRYLRRPVDLVVLNTQEHLLTEPAARIASQGGSVDWFRFWLQGYESPHPVMAGEYRRWEALCSARRAQVPRPPSFCVPARHAQIPEGRFSKSTERRESNAGGMYMSHAAPI